MGFVAGRRERYMAEQKARREAAERLRAAQQAQEQRQRNVRAKDEREEKQFERERRESIAARGGIRSVRGTVPDQLGEHVCLTTAGRFRSSPPPLYSSRCRTSLNWCGSNAFWVQKIGFRPPIWTSNSDCSGESTSFVSLSENSCLLRDPLPHDWSWIRNAMVIITTYLVQQPRGNCRRNLPVTEVSYPSISFLST